jgi:predicted dehydrogenase
MNNYEPKMVVGTTYKKVNNADCGNPWGGWDKDQHTMEDSAFGFIVMKNGATIILESSWALNTSEPIPEGSTMLCGTDAGAQIKGGVTINKGEFNRLIEVKPDLSSGGVAFYEGISDNPAEVEARRWIDAVKNDTEVVVKPEQACVVSEILEAIYTSAKSGQPVYFD